MSQESSSETKSIIHEWTKEQVESASKPNYGKIFVTAPNLLEILGDVNGKKVLEMGCGNGYWLRLLSRAGATCTGIDHAENQIEAAKQWNDPETEKIDYRVGDISTYTDMREQYDIVFFEHVLLEMPEKGTLEAALVNAANVLRPGGKLVVSDMHPFAPSARPHNMRVSENFNYFQSGAPFEVASNRVGGGIIYYKDAHWTLGDIAGAVTKANLAITEIREPLPSQEGVAQYPDELEYRLTVPMALMISAIKLSA